MKRLKETPTERINRLKEIVRVLSVRISTQEVLLANAKKSEEEAWETARRWQSKLERHGVSPFDDPTWHRWLRRIRAFFVRT